LKEITGATATVRVGTSAGNDANLNAGVLPLGNGSRLFVATATTTFVSLFFGATADGIYADFDNVSVRELAGNHAVQATAANRPIYGVHPFGGRRNLLVNTPFAGTVSGTPGTAPTNWGRVLSGGTLTAGTNTVRIQTTNARDMLFQNPLSLTNVTYTYSAVADIGISLSIQSYIGVASLPVGASVVSYVLDGVDVVSGTLTGTGVHTLGIRYLIGVTAANVVNYIGSGVNGNATGDITFSEPQLEISASRTAYQRVTDQYNVTEAGVSSVHYLFFDGADSMATPTITPGVDKAQVFAGVRKLSDAAYGIIAETSTTFSTNAGSLGLYVGGPSAVGTAYSSMSRGSQAADIGQYATINAVAPDTAVLAATHDIAGDLSTIRRNAVAGTPATGDKGTGNFLAYPLYIGARAGTSLFFSGHLYSLIARFGPNLDTGQISSTETWVAGRTGIVI
jgi:hypothetical protein